MSRTAPRGRPTTQAERQVASAAGGVRSAARIGKATLVESGRYWSRLPLRGFPPLTLARDGARWLHLVRDRHAPTWATPHTVVFETPIARLRDFSTPGSAADGTVPTLLLPPQAGHDSCIVDFSPEQSQVAVAVAAGLRTSSMDWVGATAATKDTTVEDFVAVLDRAVDHLGGRVNLVGDCQGGWLAAIYAALRPERVNTLTLAGAPIDFQAGRPAIGTWTEALGGNDLLFYRTLVHQSGGVMPGKRMLEGFKALQPEAEVEKNLQLLTGLDDPAHVARYRVFEDWFAHTQDISGAFYLWIVRHLFRDNELVAGTLLVGGEVVDLRRITCPVHLLGGATDHITPPAQVFAAAQAVGTPAADITQATTSGGHLGLFMGSESLRDFWPPIFADIARRSGGPLHDGTST